MSAITSQTRRVWILCAAVQLLAVGAVDLVTSYEISLVIFYFIPVAFASWFVGLRSGLAFSVMAAVTTTWADAASGQHYSKSWMAWEHALMHMVVFGFVAFSFGFFRNSIQRERERAQRLEGMMITFCSACTRVKDADDHWRELSTFLQDAGGGHARTKLCPTCARGVYVSQSSATDSAG